MRTGLLLVGIALLGSTYLMLRVPVPAKGVDRRQPEVLSIDQGQTGGGWQEVQDLDHDDMAGSSGAPADPLGFTSEQRLRVELLVDRVTTGTDPALQLTGLHELITLLDFPASFSMVSRLIGAIPRGSESLGDGWIQDLAEKFIPYFVADPELFDLALEEFRLGASANAQQLAFHLVTVAGSQGRYVDLSEPFQAVHDSTTDVVLQTYIIANLGLARSATVRLQLIDAWLSRTMTDSPAESGTAFSDRADPSPLACALAGMRHVLVCEATDRAHRLGMGTSGGPPTEIDPGTEIFRTFASRLHEVASKPTCSARDMTSICLFLRDHQPAELVALSVLEVPYKSAQTKRVLDHWARTVAGQ